jgi:tektin-1
LNRKAKFQLEKDLKDKFSVLSIDEYCESLKNNSQNIGFKDGTAKIEAK